MKKKIKLFILNNSCLFNFFGCFWTLVFRILKCLVPTDSKLVLFSSYSGKSFGDSPRAIYEYMKKDPRCQGYRYIWAFSNPEKFKLEDEKIKTNTLRYRFAALRAGIIIENQGGLGWADYKHKTTIRLNTWHGIPIKTIGLDWDPASTHGKKLSTTADYMLASGEYDAEIYSRALGMKKEEILIFGLPRNDELTRATLEISGDLRSKLRIPKDKIVILYAPTYREYMPREGEGHSFGIDVDFKLWRDTLGNDYLLLFRTHHATTELQWPAFEGFLMDASRHENINDLYIAADILVSDYSSAFFDYSLLGKPMICFAPDYEEYVQKRGLYFDIMKGFPFPIARNEETLLRLIKGSRPGRSSATVEFCKRFVVQRGNATKLTVDFLLDCSAKRFM